MAWRGVPWRGILARDQGRCYVKTYGMECKKIDLETMQYNADYQREEEKKATAEWEELRGFKCLTFIEKEINNFI